MLPKEAKQPINQQIRPRGGGTNLAPARVFFAQVALAKNGMIVVKNILFGLWL
jgi:hypothetical protein